MVEKRYTGRESEIPFMIYDLNSFDGLKRQRIREQLVRMGPMAVPQLIKALSSPSERIRWEVAKALGDIGDPAAAQPLVERLEDESIDVRWMSMDSLIAIGQPALLPLMEALRDRFESVWLREGAHHILHMLFEKSLLPEEYVPVFQALESIEPEVQVPWAVENVLGQAGLG